MARKGQYKQPPPADRIAVEDNNGGSFVEIELVNRTPKGDLVRIRVGHDCVIRIDQEISVFCLAAILGRAKDIGFEQMLKDEYRYEDGQIPEWAGPR